MNKLSRPQPVREAMLTDRRAEKASVCLSRLVESGFIDPVIAENLLNSGLNPRTVQRALDKSKRTAY